MSTNRDVVRLRRLVRALGKSETYRSHTGGVAYVDIRLLDAAVETAQRLTGAPTGADPGVRMTVEAYGAALRRAFNDGRKEALGLPWRK